MLRRSLPFVLVILVGCNDSRQDKPSKPQEAAKSVPAKNLPINFASWLYNNYRTNEPAAKAAFSGKEYVIAARIVRVESQGKQKAIAIGQTVRFDVQQYDHGAMFFFPDAKDTFSLVAGNWYLIRCRVNGYYGGTVNFGECKVLRELPGGENVDGPSLIKIGSEL